MSEENVPANVATAESDVSLRALATESGSLVPSAPPANGSTPFAESPPSQESPASSEQDEEEEDSMVELPLEAYLPSDEDARSLIYAIYTETHRYMMGYPVTMERSKEGVPAKMIFRTEVLAIRYIPAGAVQRSVGQYIVLCSGRDGTPAGTSYSVTIPEDKVVSCIHAFSSAALIEHLSEHFPEIMAAASAIQPSLPPETKMARKLSTSEGKNRKGSFVRIALRLRPEAASLLEKIARGIHVPPGRVVSDILLAHFHNLQEIDPSLTLAAKTRVSQHLRQYQSLGSTPSAERVNPTSSPPRTASIPAVPTPIMGSSSQVRVMLDQLGKIKLWRLGEHETGTSSTLGTMVTLEVIFPRTSQSLTKQLQFLTTALTPWRTSTLNFLGLTLQAQTVEASSLDSRRVIRLLATFEEEPKFRKMFRSHLRRMGAVGNLGKNATNHQAMQRILRWNVQIDPE
jgi:hypothetical protein